MTDQYKRNIAYKLRIGDILLGKPIFDSDKFIHLELGDRVISRVNIIGNIVDKYESEGEKKYIFFTLDDGSGQIKLKSFGEENYPKFKGISQGETVVVIGVIRNWNNETYIQPEIISAKNPKYLLVRKLELEKQKNRNTKPVKDVKVAKAIKDQILGKIKSAEEEGGIDSEKIILEFREASPDTINQEIKKLIEEGIIFEPRPGRLRYLG
ncbi:MAG: OB-fold nucleic acid binding domain-containing protein [Nanoarchaeota archaeon]|nr:OB-fold nucleic acid binding domain-containing protein [Nanoarchaeota archaeon]